MPPLPAWSASGCRCRAARVSGCGRCFGRPGLAGLGDSGADVVILDAFVGGRVPADLGTVEFVHEVRRVLKPGGLLLANVADGPPLTYLRRLLASAGEAFSHRLAIADSSVLRGRRYGNVVFAASASELPEAEIERTVAGSPFPLRVLTGAGLDTFVGAAKVLRDESSMRSPAPPDLAWRISEE